MFRKIGVATCKAGQDVLCSGCLGTVPAFLHTGMCVCGSSFPLRPCAVCKATGAATSQHLSGW